MKRSWMEHHLVEERRQILSQVLICVKKSIVNEDKVRFERNTLKYLM